MFCILYCTGIHFDSATIIRIFFAHKLIMLQSLISAPAPRLKVLPSLPQTRLHSLGSSVKLTSFMPADSIISLLYFSANSVYFNHHQYGTALCGRMQEMPATFARRGRSAQKKITESKNGPGIRQGAECRAMSENPQGVSAQNDWNRRVPGIMHGALGRIS